MHLTENRSEPVARNAATAVAFLIGGIVGATVGLLMAPCSGADTRKRIGDAATRVAGKVRDNVEEWRHEAEARLAEVGETVKAS
jgi:gas vesicle protein